MKVKAIARWISTHRCAITAYYFLGSPLLLLAFALALASLRDLKNVHHFHAVAAQFAIAKPTDWEALAAACQEVLERYRGADFKAAKRQPLPAALKVLAPAYVSYHREKDELVCGWVRGDHNESLTLVFADGKLRLWSWGIPELPMGDEETQVWPVLPREPDLTQEPPSLERAKARLPKRSMKSKM